MEFDFKELANRIAKQSVECGISVSDIMDIIYSNDEKINCYPGTQSKKCYYTALFISLNGIKAKGKGHLKFNQMLKKFVTHLHNSCPYITRRAVIITDDWWTESFESISNYIQEFKRNGVQIETYFLQPSGSAIKINI